jgi:hypothetical protein
VGDHHSSNAGAFEAVASVGYDAAWFDRLVAWRGLSMPRFRIRVLMVTTAAIGFALFLVRPLFLGRAYDSPLAAIGRLVVGASCFGLPVGLTLWRLARGEPRLITTAFATAALLTNGGVAIMSASMPYLGDLSLFGAIAAAAVGLWPVLCLGAGWASTATIHGTFPNRHPLVAWTLAIALAVLPLATSFTFWPLRLAFLVSSPAMNRLADRAAGGVPVRSAWAGLYRVNGTMVDPVTGNVGLVTDRDPSGRGGFVRVRPGTPNRGGGPFFNLYLDIPLGGGWRYQKED